LNLLALLIGILAAAAGIGMVRRRWAERHGVLTDDDIRRIEEEGSVDVEEEPLDLEDIRDEETRFWEESWDEPEEWRG
jgi:hypothetical protein